MVWGVQGVTEGCAGRVGTEVLRVLLVLFIKESKDLLNFTYDSIYDKDTGVTFLSVLTGHCQQITTLNAFTWMSTYSEKPRGAWHWDEELM